MESKIISKEQVENVVEKLSEILVDEYKMAEFFNITIEDAIDVFLYQKVSDYKFLVNIDLELIESELLLTFNGIDINIILDENFIYIKSNSTVYYSEKTIEDKLNLFSYVEEIYLEKLENKI